MALAGVGERGAEGRLGGQAARLGRQDLVERRAPEAGRARVVGAGRDQHRAAVAHIARDVVEIDDRQHALARVAVEDDEVELVDLLLEQLARRERDQRQLVDRRAVLLLRRTQNGEVHEVDAGVGLQQIAPGALAGMRLAGDQQHAQLVAHAVDRDHGAVVDGGQFAFERRRLDLDDVRPGMRDRDLRVDGVAGRDGAALDHLAVAADGDLRPACRAAPWSSTRRRWSATGRRCRSAASVTSTTRRSRSSAVPVISACTGAVEAERGGVGRHVVDAAVGDHDRAGDAVRRHVGERRAAAPRTAACRRSRRRPRRPRRSARRGPECGRAARRAAARAASVCVGAVAEVLARALVDDDRRRPTSAARGPRGSATGWRAPAPSARAPARARRAPRLRTTSSSTASNSATPQRRPQHVGGTSGANVMPKPKCAPIGPAVRAAPGRAPGRPCSCRSACTSRC